MFKNILKVFLVIEFLTVDFNNCLLRFIVLIVVFHDLNFQSENSWVFTNSDKLFLTVDKAYFNLNYIFVFFWRILEFWHLKGMISSSVIHCNNLIFLIFKDHIETKLFTDVIVLLSCVLSHNFDLFQVPGLLAESTFYDEWAKDLVVS